MCFRIAAGDAGAGGGPALGPYVHHYEMTAMRRTSHAVRLAHVRMACTWSLKQQLARGAGTSIAIGIQQLFVRRHDDEQSDRHHAEY